MRCDFVLCVCVRLFACARKYIYKRTVAMFFWLKGVGTLVTRTVCHSIYSCRKWHCCEIGVAVVFVLLVEAHL